MKKLLKQLTLLLCILICGIIVVIPAKGLGWLAGENSFPLLYMAWPIAAVVVIFSVVLDVFHRGYWYWHRPIARTIHYPITLTFLGWYCLPILLNGTSHVLRNFDLPTAAAIVFEIRWVSMLSIVVIPIYMSMLYTRVRASRFRSAQETLG